MPFPHAHALLIGIGSYAHAPQLNVPITAADANAVAAVLRDPQYCGYPQEQVTLLADAAASREGVLAALDALAARAGADNTVLVFYAGHGEYGDDGYYLTTHDTRLANRKVLSGSGLRESELIEKLRAITAKRLLLIVNACHSGEISPVLAPGEEPLTGTPVPSPLSAALLGTGEGRVIISACRENQYAFIGPGPLTLFAQALVDGLQGKGVSSNRGYIGVFDLYTHLYFALDEAVPRIVPADIRQKYGQKQEPELTILKGVGPFAVALYRGATTLGDFDGSGRLPEDTAVREVNPAYSQAMLRQHQQNISGNARVGVAVAGDNRGPITVDMSKRKVDTGGGDYAEGNVDKRSGTFVSGDQFNMSGNFSGAILNIKSTLSNVTQSIGAAPYGNAAMKVQLQALVEQLSAELQKAPTDKTEEAEQAAKRAENAVAEATKPKPDKDDVEYSLSRLKKTAENIGQVLPMVLPIATQITDTLRKMIGA